VSATDVTDGNSEEIARDGSDEEAAWLDLVGRFEAAADSKDAPAPWPDRENLGPAGESAAWPGLGARADGDSADENRASAGPGLRGPRDDGSAGPGTRSPAVGPGTGWSGDDTRAGTGPGTGSPTTGSPKTGDGEGAPDAPDPEIARRLGLPGHRRLDLPAAPDPRSWVAPDDPEDGHYIPPPPPPLPTLTPAAKGAWVALFGGPAYLLVGTLAGWTVPGWALFLAIAAFVGGFIVLVLRLGDGQDRDSGSGGAVV
jgi:hypothetical protein